MQTHQPISHRLWFPALLITFLPLLAPSTSLATTNSAFVQRAYLDLLLRPASPSDLSTWVPPLDSATMTRTQFALNVMYTDEYRHVRANEFYADFLSRLPSASELNNFTTFLQTNTLPQGRATILGSPEYFTSQGGGANAGFLNSLYLDLLARPIDPAASTAFQALLTGGTATRFDVAMAVQGSDEWRTDIVNEYYQQFLHRPADPTGLKTYKSFLSTGGTEQEVIASLLGSVEYFQNVPEPAALALLLAMFPPALMRRRRSRE